MCYNWLRYHFLLFSSKTALQVSKEFCIILNQNGLHLSSFNRKGKCYFFYDFDSNAW